MPATEWRLLVSRVRRKRIVFNRFFFDSNLGNSLCFDQKFVDLVHRPHKAIATTGNGHEKSRLRRFLAQSFSHCRNVHGEIRLFEDLARPDLFQDFVLVEVASFALHEEQKQIESLRIKRHHFAFTQ